MKPLSILVCALGGEGGGVLAEWLYTAAVRAGHAAQTTSIPGVAQRTGATTYYIEIDRRPGSAEDSAAFSLSPVPGELDVLISSELLETARQVAAGMSDPARTHILSATGRALTIAEKATPGDGRLTEPELRRGVQQQARAVDWIDLQALAQASGAALSAAMFGALGGAGLLPWGREACEAAIRDGGKGVESSLRGFAAAFDAAAALRAQRERAGAWLAEAGIESAHKATAAAAADANWPELGRERVRSYQDEAYARLFDSRLARIAEAEASAGQTPAGAVRHETARWLALWMCFDDIVRVAQAKLAARRIERVRREVGARDDEIVRIVDHFKPGIPEIAGLLPPALALRLRRWDERRIARGQDAWAWPLKLGSHTVHGALMLKLLASARWLRRRGQRWADEQAQIEAWLAAVAQGSRESTALGLALARAGGLVKGYGATQQRGQSLLRHIVEHLATGAGSAEERAEAIEQALRAARGDETGAAIDQLLHARGAPPRPPLVQTVRFYKRRPA